MSDLAIWLKIVLWMLFCVVCFAGYVLYKVSENDE